MTIDNNDRKARRDGLSPRYGSNPLDDKERREPMFGSFDEHDEVEYEEPDRDTDHASGFGADDVEAEEDIEELLTEEEDDLFLQESHESRTPYAAHRNEPNYSDDEEEEESDDWLEEEEYYEEESNGEPSWRLRLMAVAAVALILLGTGVYGVMQERAATQAELHKLRAALATSANQEDVRASREALREMKESYATLAAEVEALSLENRRLSETPANSRGKKASPDPKVPTPADKQPPPDAQSKTVSSPPSKPAPVAAKPVATARTAAQPVSSGGWFVNFGSYASRAVAESWAARLHPVTGKVIIAPTIKEDKTYYRVRVINLTGKDSAEQVARKLESELQVSRLWVGQD